MMLVGVGSADDRGLRVCGFLGIGHRVKSAADGSGAASSTLPCRAALRRRLVALPISLSADHLPAHATTPPLPTVSGFGGARSA